VDNVVLAPFPIAFGILNAKHNRLAGGEVHLPVDSGQIGVVLRLGDISLCIIIASLPGRYNEWGTALV